MTESNIKGKDQTEETFDTWIESYANISKLWEESYIKLHRPWLECTRELFEKAIDTANSNSPDRYKEFYETWTNTFRGKVEKLGKVATTGDSSEILEKLLASAEKTNDICRSWIIELEDNSKKTREALKGDVDHTKYKEMYDLWIKSYSKIFDEFLTLPFRYSVREIFEKNTGMPDVYSDTFIKISRLWNDSYTKLYGTWTDAILELSNKSEEISNENATPESYKEFYDLWINVYQRTYGKILNVQFAQGPTEGKDKIKTTFEIFAQSIQTYTDLYKSWALALEKLSLKSMEFKRQSNTEVYKETFDLWVKLHQKAFDSFFDNIPVASPFEEFFISIRSTGNT